MKADGTFLSWSKPFDFTVVSNEALSPSDTGAVNLAVLESELASEQFTDAVVFPETVAERVHAEEYVDAESMEATDSVTAVTVSPDSVPMPAENSQEDGDALLIEQLAEACSRQEWWTNAGLAST